MLTCVTCLMLIVGVVVVGRLTGDPPPPTHHLPGELAPVVTEPQVVGEPLPPQVLKPQLLAPQSGDIAPVDWEVADDQPTAIIDRTYAPGAQSAPGEARTADRLAPRPMR